MNTGAGAGGWFIVYERGEAHGWLLAGAWGSYSLTEPAEYCKPFVDIGLAYVLLDRGGRIVTADEGRAMHEAARARRALNHPAP